MTFFVTLHIAVRRRAPSKGIKIAIIDTSDRGRPTLI